MGAPCNSLGIRQQAGPQAVTAPSSPPRAGDPANRPALGLIASGPVPAPVEALYGRWTVARLALTRAAFLMKVGAMPNLWSATHPKTGPWPVGGLGARGCCH